MIVIMVVGRDAIVFIFLGDIVSIIVLFLIVVRHFSCGFGTGRFISDRKWYDQPVTTVQLLYHYRKRITDSAAVESPLRINGNLVTLATSVQRKT